ncbi:hypothetical protein ACJIZ3_019480 [Penstemon smallii]|uniref:50S ribosomal protein 6, chloroplastic n=1 Tax=Penstemon smallii TaxID=265156 RepID=A0ABD3T1Y2_9LAMI
MSTVSAIFGARLVVPLPCSAATKATTPPPRLVFGGGNGGLVIECSSRPQKKATKHHMKTRPRKTNPSDRRHGPAVYPPLPPLPPDWTLLSDDTTADTTAASTPQLVESK